MTREKWQVISAGLALGARLQRVHQSTKEKARGDWVDALGLPAEPFDRAVLSLVREGLVQQAAGILFWTGPSIDEVDWEDALEAFWKAHDERKLER